MKKVKLILVLLVGYFSLAVSVNNKDVNKISIKAFNTKAIADSEIIVGPICAHVSTRVCLIDGNFLVMGERMS